ncbi:MAG TPA: hypothetical protein VMN37_10545 [Gemmatimonadales bacterium]|nr:hypothetical protein [Gemmatimonadales bacterium]
MPADSSAATAPDFASTPLPERTAFAILGTMIFLILALTGVLVQTTWGDPVRATEVPAIESEQLARH